MKTIHFEIRKRETNCEPLVLRGTFEKPFVKEGVMMLKSRFELESFNHYYWKEDINHQLTTNFYLKKT